MQCIRRFAAGKLTNGIPHEDLKRSSRHEKRDAAKLAKPGLATGPVCKCGWVMRLPRYPSDHMLGYQRKKHLKECANPPVLIPRPEYFQKQSWRGTKILILARALAAWTEDAPHWGRQSPEEAYRLPGVGRVWRCKDCDAIHKPKVLLRSPCKARSNCKLVGFGSRVRFAVVHKLCTKASSSVKQETARQRQIQKEAHKFSKKRRGDDTSCQTASRTVSANPLIGDGFGFRTILQAFQPFGEARKGASRAVTRPNTGPPGRLLRSDGSLAMSPAEQGAAIADEWLPRWTASDDALARQTEARGYAARAFRGVSNFPVDQVGWTPQEILHHCNNSAPGPDGWEFRRFKQVGQDHLDKLAQVYNAIDSGAPLPKEWHHARLVCIAKVDDPGATRPISILQVAYRIWSSRWARKLAEWSPPASLTAGEFAARLSEAHLRGAPLAAAFLDTQKCFDLVELASLRELVRALRGPCVLDHVLHLWHGLKRHVWYEDHSLHQAQGHS